MSNLKTAVDNTKLLSSFMKMPRLATGLFLLSTPLILFPTLAPRLTVTAFIMTLSMLLASVERPQSRLTGAIVVLLICALIGTVISPNLALSLPRLAVISWGVLAWWLLLVWGKEWSNSRRFGLYLALGFVMAGVGLISADLRPKFFSLGVNSLLDLPESPRHGVSLNQVAAVILYFWPLLVMYSFYKRKLVPILAAFWTVMLIVTQSRTAWAAAVCISVFTILVILSQRQRQRLLLIALVLSTVAAGLVVAQLDFSALQQAWQATPSRVPQGSLESIGVRREIWRWGLVALLESPLTGVGLGTFREIIYAYPARLPIDYDIAHAHNIFLQVALDFGVVGLCAYLYLVGACLRLSWKMASLQNGRHLLGTGFLATLLVVHLFGLFDALALGSKPSLLFWLLLALIELSHDHPVHS